MLLVVVLCWVARKVVVGDDSDLCTAMLLGGLVGRIKGGGSLLGGRELAGGVEGSGGAGGEGRGEPMTVVYGVVEMGDGTRGLGIGEDVRPLDPWREAFPRGRYA